MDLKRPLTFSEQVEKLKEYSIIITDDEQKDAEEYLSHVNYYKLSGYTLQFRKDAESSGLQRTLELDMRHWKITSIACQYSEISVPM